MKTIKFNYNFLPFIKSGKKTQTRRMLKAHDATETYPIIEDGHIKDYNFHHCWHSIENYIKGYSKYQIGENLQISFVKNGVVKKSLYIIKIIGIRIESIKDISNDDVIKEGFENKDQFLNAMEEIYGKGCKYCFVYDFELAI